MPLQSGKTIAAASMFATDLSDFFIQFHRAVFQKKLADFCITRFEPIYLYQPYHIIGVFYNAPLMTVFNGVAFEGKQMVQRDNFDGARTGRRGHSFRQELRERVVTDKHQVKRQ